MHCAQTCSAGRPALQADERIRIGTQREPHTGPRRFAQRPESGYAAALRRPPNTAAALLWRWFFVSFVLFTRDRVLRAFVMHPSPNPKPEMRDTRFHFPGTVQPIT
jgi:hypothetical protein